MEALEGDIIAVEIRGGAQVVVGGGQLNVDLCGCGLEGCEWIVVRALMC